MKLYIARDKMFDQLYFHTEKPKYKDKIYISNGTSFEVKDDDIKDFFKDLTTEFGPQELNVIIDVGILNTNGERKLIGEFTELKTK
jgi:hypothetical protein